MERVTFPAIYRVRGGTITDTREPIPLPPEPPKKKQQIGATLPLSSAFKKHECVVCDKPLANHEGRVCRNCRGRRKKR